MQGEKIKMEYKIVEKKGEKKPIAVLVNPLGDAKNGWLGWDKIEFFKTRKEARAWIKIQQNKMKGRKK